MMIFAAGRDRQVYITKKRMKNIVMRMNEDGSLRISCPFRTTQAEIASFILQKQDWIEKTEKSVTKKQEKTACGTDRKTCMWLGREYQVRIEQAGKSWISFEGDTAVFHLKTISDEEITRVFYRAAGKQLAAFLNELREEWDRKICDVNYLRHPVIRLKYMTSRWGSCTPLKNSISISLRLIHFPPVCLEYVLLHEYAHLLVPNHSKAFYDIVRKHMPEWKTYSDMLK